MFEFQLLISLSSMFYHGSKNWLMDDKADPSDGWPTLDVQRTAWPASQDWYGKLFTYICDELKRFLECLGKAQINFDMYSVDVKELPRYLPHGKFSRVEVCLSTKV